MYYYEKIWYQNQLKELFKIQFMIFLLFAMTWKQQAILFCNVSMISILDIIWQQKRNHIKIVFNNLKEVLKDLPRHHFFQYINQYSLSNEFFQQAYQTIENGYIYIILSDTKSPASQLISIFTKKQYNHVSIAFDEDLKTMVSYNNGENISPPGLNSEKISHFCKRQGASMIVYRLPATEEQKRAMILKIEQINREGSSYNTIGLFLKFSFQPNIMFCSQFVYHLLDYADITYFNKRSEYVTPMDFVELDYKRKLQFVYDRIL